MPELSAYWQAAPQQTLINLLRCEGVSCVIRSGEKLHMGRERGVRDLYELLLSEPTLLRGAVVVDKVVGKGAAALMILGGVERCYAEVVSRPALELARRYGLVIDYGLLTEHIINRQGSDWCPVERRCHDLSTPKACFEAIRQFLDSQPIR